MTTLLPPRDTAVLRSIVKSSAVLIALMFIERLYAARISSEDDLSALLQIDPRTVRKQLVSLSAAGLVSACGADRWMLTPEGRGTLFAQNAQASYLSIEGTAEGYSMPQISAQNVPLEEDIYTQTNNVESSSSDSKSKNCEKNAQILQAASSLFDADVFIHNEMLERDPGYVLGWVSKAWNDRKRLNSPTSLIYRRLMEFAPLPVMYQKEPARGLPASFLCAIGLADSVEVIDVEPADDFEEEYQPETITSGGDMVLFFQVMENLVRSPIKLAQIREEVSGCREELMQDQYHVFGMADETAGVYQDRYGRQFEHSLLGILSRDVKVVFHAVEVA